MVRSQHKTSPFLWLRGAPTDIRCRGPLHFLQYTVSRSRKKQVFWPLTTMESWGLQSQSPGLSQVKVGWGVGVHSTVEPPDPRLNYCHLSQLWAVKGSHPSTRNSLLWLLSPQTQEWLSSIQAELSWKWLFSRNIWCVNGFVFVFFFFLFSPTGQH